MSAEAPTAMPTSVWVSGKAEINEKRERQEQPRRQEDEGPLLTRVHRALSVTSA